MTTAFSAHGLKFRVTSPDADVEAVFDDLLVDMRAPMGVADHTIELRPVPGTSADDSSDRARAFFGVHLDDQTIYETLRTGSLVSHVLMEINQRAAASVWSAGAAPLHASAANGPHGTIVVAGASQSGKTTLAAALALAGGDETGFVADEVCALDPVDDVVWRYGKPAALRAPGSELLAPALGRLRRPGSRFEQDERFVPPSEFGATPPITDRITAIVFPRFDAALSAGEPSRLTAVAPVEALTRLMRLTLGRDAGDVTTFRRLERLVRGVAAWDLVFGDAQVAAERLGDALTGSTRP
jgi:hypothetical protein